MPVPFLAHAALLLAQTTAPAAAPPSWWSVALSNAFGLTLVFIFLTAVVGAVIRARQRDKCLKMLQGDHVTYLTQDGQVKWGDLRVYSQGVELVFDAPYTTRQGLVLTSELIYEASVGANLAVCRIEQSLAEGECERRRRQIRRSFNPGFFRRARRGVVNFVNMIRDAFSKAISTILGHVATLRPGSSVLNQQRSSLDQIGQTLLGTFARAYEPILERHIGKPVILRLINPADATKKPWEFPGYLVDYSDRFLAVFNVEHEPLEELTVPVTGPAAHPAFEIQINGGKVRLRCLGPDAIIVRGVERAGVHNDLGVLLLPGSMIDLRHGENETMSLRLARTRRMDIVCQRSVGTVLFGGEPLTPRKAWTGLAPEFWAGRNDKQ